MTVSGTMSGNVPVQRNATGLLVPFDGKIRPVIGSGLPTALYPANPPADRDADREMGMDYV
jgi:hypothetical protein